MHLIAKKHAVRVVVFVAGWVMLCLPGSVAADDRGRNCPLDVSGEVLELTNIFRQLHGLPSLRLDPRLVMSATIRARRLAESQRLSHSGWLRSIEAAGYRQRPVGENAAAGYPTAVEVVEGWYTSRGHRDNMLNEEYRVLGVGCSADERGRLWWAEHFGVE